MKMVVDVRTKLRLAIGSVKDHATIGKAMIIGRDVFSDIEIAIVRATGHANAPIDERYVHEILFLVSNSPRSVSFLAARISRRLDKARDRNVALKTLLLVHRLLRGGDRNFEQDLRNAYLSGDLRMNLDWFLKNFDGSISFLHDYALFLEERMGWVINQAGKLEPVRPKSSEYQFYEEKSVEMVFCKLPKCQAFLDRIMDCLPVESVRSDRTAQAALSNILRESFQIYMNFNEGVTTLVDTFFDFKKPKRALALDIFRRASSQSYKIFDFFENCKRIISSKSLDYPPVRIITTACVSTMEEFLSCSQAFGNGRSAISNSNSPSFNVLIKPMAAAVIKEAEKRPMSVPNTPFSRRMETKISTVWVQFDDEDTQESCLSMEGFNDRSMGIFDGLEFEGRDCEWLDGVEPCSYNNPFVS
ncbi:putative clathrin assembly protein At1g33340 [Magnolia sinica]|uniref:putative clathrin assembly protein At1g33340 n=1 Tax=Magnolia sinica TaxID=86752 RepID=UPI002657E6FA|nr:putative clathrin assembly protein At1g33340 [Magnolia sinica]